MFISHNPAHSPYFFPVCVCWGWGRGSDTQSDLGEKTLVLFTSEAFLPSHCHTYVIYVLKKEMMWIFFLKGGGARRKRGERMKEAYMNHFHPWITG